MTKWHWGFWPSILFTVCGRARAAARARRTISLRVDGIAFAMVTLAFAQAGSVLAFKNPGELTGGEDGFGVDYTKLPSEFVGIFNTKNLYWLALVLRAPSSSSSGAGRSTRRPGRSGRRFARTSCASRCSGMRPFDYKLMSCVLASFLATLGGIVYLMLISGASPDVTTPPFTLALLIMVVIGGTGSRWGALIGGVVYTYLDHRLADLAGSSARLRPSVGAARPAARADCSSSASLFILIVYFAPGGLARLGRIRRRPAALEEAL